MKYFFRYKKLWVSFSLQNSRRIKRAHGKETSKTERREKKSDEARKEKINWPADFKPGSLPGRGNDKNWCWSPLNRGLPEPAADEVGAPWKQCRKFQVEGKKIMFEELARGRQKMRELDLRDLIIIAHYLVEIVQRWPRWRSGGPAGRGWCIWRIFRRLQNVRQTKIVKAEVAEPVFPRGWLRLWQYLKGREYWLKHELWTGRQKRVLEVRGEIRYVLTAAFRKPSCSSPTQNVQPRSAFEDTSFGPGFEIN